VIRLAEDKDAQDMLTLFSKLDSETEFMLFEPGERKTTLGEQKRNVSYFLEDESKAMIVAEDKGIVGFSVLIGGNLARNSHVVSLVMGIEKSSWGKGVGSKLLDFTITLANEMQFSRIELTVHTTNNAAINLYKKFGFKIEGERSSSIKLGGILVNEYYMAKV